MLVLAAASVAIGSRPVTGAELWWGLAGHTDTIGEAAVYVRVPRTLLAIVIGAALAVSGAVMQGVTRNPLADPGILGVNMGAALAVVIGIAWFGMWELDSYVWAAIVGGGAAACFVYFVGSLGRGGATPLKLALAGAATAAALSSLISAVVLPRPDISDIVQSWHVGGVGGASFEAMGTVVPFLAVGGVLAWVSGRWLNSLSLGDDIAAGLGVRVAWARGGAALAAVLLCSAATAVAGPIGFVGLIIPHLCRLLVGTDYRWLIPCSALMGAALLIAADIIGRVVARPEEIAVGIVTALIGAPVFIAVARRQKMRAL